jgi:small subunit ribosomal protein S20
VANIKSARKRARQAEKTRKANMGMRSLMRTKIKSVVNACDAGNKEAAVAAYKDAVPVIDSMINKGIVSKNKAARHKSRLKLESGFLFGLTALLPAVSTTCTTTSSSGLIQRQTGAISIPASLAVQRRRRNCVGCRRNIR